MAQSAKGITGAFPHFCGPKTKNMKQVKRTHRILAVIMGIAIVVTLVVQILKDGQVISEGRAVKQQQQTNNTRR